MAIYVDEARWLWKGQMWCHMAADDLEELHNFAEKIGMKRVWFQFPKTRYPHYDLNPRRRYLAVQMGAVEVSSRYLLQKSVALRGSAEIEHILSGPPTKGRRRGILN